MRRQRHGRQRGQVIPIVGIAAVLLLGATALAVDLSINTHTERNLQNVTDAAALAGAADLPAVPAAADQQKAATDALLLIHKQMGWPTFSGSNTSWANSATTPCSPAQNESLLCSLRVVPPAPASAYTITIETPAVHAANPAIRADNRYVSVTLALNGRNSFAGVIGMATSTEAATSVAYHFAPGQPYGFALFTKSYATTANHSSVVNGDVYADRYIAPQSNGKASFCAQNGLVLLGYPQKDDGAAYQNDGQWDTRAQWVNYPPSGGSGNSCGDGSSITGGTVNQTRDPQAGCTSSAVKGVAISARYEASVKACVTNPPLIPPQLEQPTIPQPQSTYGCGGGKVGGTYQPGLYACASGTALNVDAPLAPGVYEIRGTQSTQVTVGQTADLSHCTFILEGGVGFTISGNGVQVTMSPYVPSPSTGNPGDGHFSIYAPPGSPSQISIQKNGATLTAYGTLYAPDGQVSITQNAAVTLTGQAIVGVWDNQGGNHPSADITYDASQAAPQREILQLVQ